MEHRPSAEVDQRSASGIAVQQNGHRPAPAGPPRRVSVKVPRARHAWRARAGSLIIAGAGVLGVAWYVPHVMDADHSMLTGTVNSTGVVSLNFTNSGQISKLKVQNGAKVHGGEVLAIEYAPQVTSVVKADQAAVSAEQAKIAQLKTQNPAPADEQAEVQAAQAQLAADQAQEETDQQKVTDTEIIAPEAGTVIAVNGAAGEVVTAQGIKVYGADTQQGSSSQRPAFSLVPEGPQAQRQDGKSQSLPVIALRTSDAWQVDVLIPESSVAGISTGTHVQISVPAANIKNVPGTIEEIGQTPVSTTEGTAYEAVVTVNGDAQSIPLDGMAADVQLDS